MTSESHAPDVMRMTVIASAQYRSGSGDKSLSCPVCGKNFPRGGVDLDRHCSAKTLNHYTTSQMIPDSFIFKCTCNLYFSSAEFLELHRKTICVDTGPHEKILPIPVNASRRSNTSGKRYHGNIKDIKVAHISGESENEDRNEGNRVGPKRGISDGAETSSHGVGKRMRIVDPLDRKTFFAIISLLIPPESVGPKMTITTHNFDKFIPKEHVGLVNKLKEKLNWSA